MDHQDEKQVSELEVKGISKPVPGRITRFEILKSIYSGALQDARTFAARLGIRPI
jgi:hypothetical protein